MIMCTPLSGCRYSVDDCDVIVEIGSGWSDFATENGGCGLTADALIGRPLFDFIADDSTRLAYRDLHAHVRETGRAVSVPFRCDSPTKRRAMQLTLECGDEGRLLYQTSEVEVQPQERVSVLDSAEKRSVAFLTMCSLCKRSLIEPIGWVEPAKVNLDLRLYERETVPTVRYTVCPDCSHELQLRTRRTAKTAGNAEAN
jgi:hypothetical protein